MKPKLRFQGFHDDWEEKKLGEISKRITQKNKNLDYTETLTNSAEKGIVSQLDFFDKSISNTNNIDGYYVINHNDFVYNPRISKNAPFGPIRRNKLNRSGVMSPLYLPFTIINQHLNFIEQYFYTTCWHGYIYSIGDSGVRADRVSIKYNDFFNMPIQLPSLPEQEKIGAFLSQLDNRIEKQEQKIALLKERKKGWMQQLFSQTIRFKDENGQDYPAWEEKKLGKVCEPKQWSTIDSSKLLEKGFPVYGANGIIGYYTEYNHENSEVCITCRGATCGNVHLTQEKSYITGNAMVLESLKTNLKYMYYYLIFRGMKDIITGSAQPQITGQLLKVIKVLLPSLPEQEKIAEFLSKQDELIEKEEEKLSLLKEQKKGFLQQMFV